MKQLRPSAPFSFISRGNSKDGPDASFPTSYSSPQLHLSDDQESSGLQVQLSAEEKSYLPLYSTQDQGLIQMKEIYLSEAIPEWGLRGKHYLSSQDRAFYEIKLENGLYKDANGDVLHGDYLYVLFPNNKLYGCKLGKQRFHSYLSSGLNVKAAGVLYCLYGRMITISNESGHYKPTYLEMLPALLHFQDRSPTQIIFEDHSKLDTTLPYQGVKHYRLSIIDKKISCELIASIDALRELIVANATNAELCLRTQRLSISDPVLEDSPVSAYDFLGGYYDDEGGYEENFQSVPNNSFMTQTCLMRMTNPDYHSRFIGRVKKN
jgi:hypothetical protein